MKSIANVCTWGIGIPCADLEGDPPPMEFAKLNIADITGNEKINYLSYLCTSTVIRQTESIHKITK